MLNGTCVIGEEAGARNRAFFLGDEGYLVCVCGGLDRFEVHRFLLGVLQRVVVHVCVVLCAC